MAKSGTGDARWASLYRIGAVAALVFLAYTLATLIILTTVGGPPESVEEGFEMLASNRLIGLLRLDLLTVLFIPLYYPILLALYLALRNVHPSAMLLAAVLALAGVTLFLTTPSTFPFLVVSDKYAAATTEAQKAGLLAAGEAILASDMWHSSGALVSGLLLQVGALIMTVLMLRAGGFGRLTAWAGIGTYALDLAHILVGFVLPSVSVVLMMISGTLYLLWFPLLARDLFRLARDQGGAAPMMVGAAKGAPGKE
jgi:hypothetical protein